MRPTEQAGEQSARPPALRLNARTTRELRSMPAVSYDSLSFLLDGARTRASRLSVVAAAFDPTLVEPTAWQANLVGLRHAGFNTVVMRVPWSLHEPTLGRFVFDGPCDVRKAVEVAAGAGLKVALRIGPCVGGSYAHGGLPPWLYESIGSLGASGPRIREASAGFMDRVSRFWRALAPHCVDLQATRNGGGARPIIAVGIENDWRCLDGEVGGAYFSSLVRYAREVGIDVPLFSANNHWYTHEGVIDAWSGSTNIMRTVEELRQVSPDAPPLLMHSRTDDAGMLSRVLASVASRADFVCEVVGTRHTHATSVTGEAQCRATDLFMLRRPLVFASAFGEVLAGLVPSERVVEKDARVRTTLRGNGATECVITIDDRATNTASAFEVIAKQLKLGRSMLQSCSGSIVALRGDVLVVAGRPRSKVTVEVDGSRESLTVPSDGKLPRVTKVRGVQIAVVTHEMAMGVGLTLDALEFVDRAGRVLACIRDDGTVTDGGGGTTSSLGAGRAKETARTLELAAPQLVTEYALLDGTHPRFASMHRPSSLGTYGLSVMHGYYSVRTANTSKKGREQLVLDARGVRRDWRVARSKKETAHTYEIAANDLRARGSHIDGRIGLFGPMMEIAPLKGVKHRTVELPNFDATAIGRFAWGYEPRNMLGAQRTVEWTFAPRATAVLVRFPEQISQNVDAAPHRLRLNGVLLDTELVGRRDVLLDGALLAPKRPAPTPKGQKPATGRNVKFVAGENELMLDLDPHGSFSDADLKLLAKETEFFEVCGEVSAAWSFARVEPPASWALAAVPSREKSREKSPRKSRDEASQASGVPSWWRWVVHHSQSTISGAQTCVEITVTQPRSMLGTVLWNGESVMVLDGVSGERGGTAKKQTLTRTMQLPMSRVYHGDNALCVFSPDGAIPTVSVMLVAR